MKPSIDFLKLTTIDHKSRESTNEIQVVFRNQIFVFGIMQSYLLSVLQVLSSPFSCFGCPTNEETTELKKTPTGSPESVAYSKSSDALLSVLIQENSTQEQNLRLDESFAEPEDESIPMNQIPENNVVQEKKNNRQLILWPPKKHQDPFIAIMAAQWEAKMSGTEIDNSNIIAISRERIDQLKRQLFKECRLGLLEEF